MRVPESERTMQKGNVEGRRVLDSIQNKAVRPYRNDGYANVLNKYGTSRDNSEAYNFEREPTVPDLQLGTLYEGNGLFAKIIDTPAEEALKHGFDLGLNNEEASNFVEEALDELEWEEKATTAIKWARLYGGSIIVMLINDGKGLEDPVDWESIKSIDELRVFERAVVQPDYTSLYTQDFGTKGQPNRASKFGQPEFFYVSSIYGSFKVHESRCLVFRNGVLPEQISNSTYQFWGMPEYVRIKRALRETTTAHSDVVKLLERSVQAIYSMKNLAQTLATDDGEEQVLKRLEVIDMARGLLNSIAIDADGEQYDFKTFQFSGVKDVIDATCNMLSALTNIPQSLLFGRSPSGMDATGESDLENWYNFVERIQKLSLKKNLRYLLDVIFRAGVASGEIAEEPPYKLKFNPLWSMSEAEQANVEQTKANTALVKAQTAQVYVDMQAIDPQEVRHRLASDEEFVVEDIVEEDDDNDLYSSLFGEEAGAVESEAEAIERNVEQEQPSGGLEQTAGNAMEPKAEPIEPAAEPAKDKALPLITKDSADEPLSYSTEGEPDTVGVIVIKDGSVLTGVRKSNFHPYKICGAGGHIEEGETAEQAAIREAQEEFGITPVNPELFAIRTGLAEEYGTPAYFVCTEYEGEVRCDDPTEMVAPQWLDLGAVLSSVEANSDNLFLPFADSFRVLNNVLSERGQQPDDGKGDDFSEKNEKKLKKNLPSDENVPIIKEEVPKEDEYNPSQPRDKDGKFSGNGESSATSTEEPTGTTLETPTAKDFKKTFAKARESYPKEGRWRVSDDYAESDYEGMQRRATKGGSTFAIHDGDIVSVCHNPDDPVRGKTLMKMAVEAGGTKLDSYDGNHKFYVKCGFEPVSWCKWDANYAPKGWDESGCGGEDIIFYKYTGKTSNFLTADAFKQAVAASTDYDAAQKERDNTL